MNKLKKDKNAAKKRNVLVEYIRQRILLNDHAVIVAIEGKTGTGKSEVAMRLCEQVDPNFNIERVVFHVNDYTDLMVKKFPKGSAFILEEAQVAAHNRNYYSKQNKTMFYNFTTQRLFNYLTVMTLPDTDTLDKQIRHNADISLKTTGNFKRKGKKDGLCKVNVSFPTTLGNKSKIYNMPLLEARKKEMVKIKFEWVQRPERKLLRLYKHKKENYVSSLTQTNADALYQEKK